MTDTPEGVAYLQPYELSKGAIKIFALVITTAADDGKSGPVDYSIAGKTVKLQLVDHAHGGQMGPHTSAAVMEVMESDHPDIAVGHYLLVSVRPEGDGYGTRTHYVTRPRLALDVGPAAG